MSFIREYYVYSYSDNNGEIFYIGKGKEYRCFVHLSPSVRSRYSSTFFYRKLNKMLYNNETIVINKLFENLTNEEAITKEKELITTIGRRDLKKGTLCNRTDGGEGGTRIPSKETRKKMSDANKRNGTPPAFTSASAKARWKDPKFIAMMKEKRTKHIPVTQLLPDGTFEYWKSHHEAAVYIKGISTRIIECCKGKRNKHKKSKWSYGWIH